MLFCFIMVSSPYLLSLLKLVVFVGLCRVFPLPTHSHLPACHHFIKLSVLSLIVFLLSMSAWSMWEISTWVKHHLSGKEDLFGLICHSLTQGRWLEFFRWWQYSQFWNPGSESSHLIVDSIKGDLAHSNICWSSSSQQSYRVSTSLD